MPFFLVSAAAAAA